MFVSKVKLYKFRNLADQQVELSEGPVYISGLNGNGKTNLIEAVYLLTGSRSFRTNSTTELLRFGERECSVFGTVTQASGTEELGLVFTASGRTGSLNGEAPVILLDDVDSELDAGRSERLFAALLRKPRQLIITGTTSPPEQLGRHAALQLLRVEKGIVGPA